MRFCPGCGLDLIHTLLMFKIKFRQSKPEFVITHGGQKCPGVKDMTISEIEIVR